MSVKDANHWRDRAAHMRALSEMMDSEAAAIVLRLADDYDKLADRAAGRSRKGMQSATPSDSDPSTEDRSQPGGAG